MRPKLEAEIAAARAELAATAKPSKADFTFSPEVAYVEVARGIAFAVRAAEQGDKPEGARFIGALQQILGNVIVVPVGTDDRPIVEMMGIALRLEPGNEACGIGGCGGAQQSIQPLSCRKIGRLNAGVIATHFRILHRITRGAAGRLAAQGPMGHIVSERNLEDKGKLWPTRLSYPSLIGLAGRRRGVVWKQASIRLSRRSDGSSPSNGAYGLATASTLE